MREEGNHCVLGIAHREREREPCRQRQAIGWLYGPKMTKLDHPCSTTERGRNCTFEKTREIHMNNEEKESDVSTSPFPQLFFSSLSGPVSCKP